MATQTIALHEKFANKTADIFSKESVIAGILSDEYTWEGAKTIKVSTITTTPMNDYDRKKGDNRFGDPVEVGDTVQEMEVTQDKSFSSTVDKGNYVDQSAMKTGAKVLALQLKERAVPEADRYILSRLAYMAGSRNTTNTKITKANVMDRITDGTVVLDDAEVPDTGRTLLISAPVYKMLRLSDEFIGNEKLAVRAIAKGQVGEIDGMAVVKVPSGRWPAGVNFMIVHKNAATAPFKIDDTYMHTNPPGLSGVRIEGRKYYDCFVFFAKALGVYADIDTTVKDLVAEPAVTIASNKATVSTASDVTFKYTVNGADPRYTPASKVLTYTGPVALEAGDTIKVFGEDNAGKKYPSTTVEKTNV